MAEQQVAVGEEVSFTLGSGLGVEGHVGRVVAIEGDGVVVMFVRYSGASNDTRFLRNGTFVRGAIRYCDAGRESALDHAARIEEAIRRSKPCPHCGAAPSSGKAGGA